VEMGEGWGGDKARVYILFTFLTPIAKVSGYIYNAGGCL